jgi:uncharacterized protein VirK/YbjX
LQAPFARRETINVISKNISWLWINSRAICDGTGIVSLVRRLRFLARALAVYDSVTPIINAPPGSALARAIESRPETIGAVIWPYQCLDWDARARLARIHEHYSIIDGIGGPINFPTDDEILLLELGDIRQGLRVVLDRPRWFIREGQLAINLFLDDVRLYSLLFSLLPDASGIAAFVGAIQGRDLEGILDEYRSLTKAAHGARPRDLLIEVFRMFCELIGVTRIYAVADEHRQHRSAYYGPLAYKKLNVDYDEVWEDRGGVRTDPRYYELEVGAKERDLAGVPTKKRSMYRKRYEMLRELGSRMKTRWDALSNETTAKAT